MESTAQTESTGGAMRSADPLLSRRALFALAGLATLAACSDQPKPPVFSFTPERLFYGASTPPDKLASFEATLGEPLGCHRTYFQAGDEASLHQQVISDLDIGRMPIPSIKTPGSWADTAADTAWIDGLLEPLSDVDHTVFLGVHHEPENDDGVLGDSADYVRLQRAVLARIARVARNVMLVPILASWSFDERAKRAPSEWNVPEAPVYGLDLYNPWAVANGKAWVPFSDKLSLALKDAAGRPILISEYGCRTDPAMPGRAAEWLVDAFDAAVSAGVVAMSYFNSSRNSPDGSWELDAETLPAFQALMDRPEVVRL